MKKVAVLGVGRMGQAICWCMKKLGYYVIGMDSNEHAAHNFRKHINGNEGEFYLTDQNNADKMMEAFILHNKPDVVISSLPYHQTEEIAYWCIDNSFRYCDLGGRVDVSHNINEYAKQKGTAPVMTDLGLAPGWVNILAEHGCKELNSQAHTVEMMVGGIPVNRPSGPLKYVPTWSIDGLLNEYRDDCEILLDGELQTVKGLSNYILIEPDWDGCVGLEAFCTSGGAAHSIKSMQKKGVKNCMYRTLRWIGHHELLNFLMNTCKLDDETLTSCIHKSAECEKSTDDVVIIIVSITNKKGLSWRKEKVIYSDEDFTAMQKSTAFPISSIAAILAEGTLEGNKDQHRDYYTQYSPSLNYEDVPYEKLEKNLDKLFNA